MESSDAREQKIIRVTLIGAVANCLLTLCKVAVGIIGNSAAMIADGIHSLSDLISDFVVLIFVKISSKEQDKEHDYGHGKFEVLATLIVSMLLIFVGVKLLTSGINSILCFINGEELKQPSIIAFYMALISIATKEILYQITARVGRKVESQAVIANAWHHRTDAISSIGSLLGIAGAIFLGERCVVLDPIASCIISLFIFFIAIKMGGESIKELMEVSLSDEEEKKITSLIESVDGIKDVHNLKTRRNGRSVIIDVHIVVDPHITVIEAHEMTVEAEKSLLEHFGHNSQIFIHIEPEENAL
ncbi:MAG: cation diffusion facilitator family transporter [Paludibacteraceae bacterium]|nr:cation diffusion facilitator family transporter [Paludibacteraceae bacterium]